MNAPLLHLLVVDTETGGLDPAVHCIIEIAAAHVTIEGWVVTVHDRFNVRTLPDRAVDPQAAAVNGYTPERWADTALPMPIAARDFLAWIAELPEGLIWTGSNVTGFDLPFLRSDFARAGFELPGKPQFSRRKLNTESLCFPLFAKGEIEGCGLRHLRKWAGLEGEQHHTAAEDVADTVIAIREYFGREVRP